MFQKTFRHALLPIIVTLLVVSSTFVLLQQTIRNGVNDELVNVADSVVAAVEKNRAVLDSQPQDQLIDPSKSNAIFIQAYNEDGSLILSTLGVDGNKDTKIPKKVLDNIKVGVTNYVTWAPKKDTRLATVTKKFGGDKPGFILTGKSLKSTDLNAHIVGKLAVLCLLASLIIILLASFAIAYFETPRMKKAKVNAKKEVQDMDKTKEEKVTEVAMTTKKVAEKPAAAKSTSKAKPTTKKR
jgi:hypothetical protein